MLDQNSAVSPCALRQQRLLRSVHAPLRGGGDLLDAGGVSVPHGRTATTATPSPGLGPVVAQHAHDLGTSGLSPGGQRRIGHIVGISEQGGRLVHELQRLGEITVLHTRVSQDDSTRHQAVAR
jgi:hypothetical protein